MGMNFIHNFGNPGIVPKCMVDCFIVRGKVEKHKVYKRAHKNSETFVQYLVMVQKGLVVEQTRLGV